MSNSCVHFNHLEKIALNSCKCDIEIASYIALFFVEDTFFTHKIFSIYIVTDIVL